MGHKLSKRKRKKLLKTSTINRIENFLRVLPCSINFTNGNSMECKSCFNEIQSEEIKYRKRRENDIKEVESTKKSEYIGMFDLDFNLEVNLLNSQAEFRQILKLESEESKKYDYYFCKHILFSLDINSNLIKFNPYYENLFSNIAYSNSSNENKAKELDDIFQSIGYFVPLRIDIGGMFYSEIGNKS